MCDRWKRRRGDGRASRSISRLVDMEADSVLRRSLRRINPFRNKLFRLPATPRLSRNRKIRNGEDVVTEWNFERASFRSIGKGANGFISGGLDFSSVDTISLPGNSKVYISIF
uniref:Coat protein n=1 Tax=Heterorhabditis bacteriophora TaxID=37862 RepID=A0A1I7WKJ5_HETBA